MHDTTALECIGQLDAVNPQRITADTGYQGTGRKTAYKRIAKDAPLSEHKRQCNNQHGKAKILASKTLHI